MNILTRFRSRLGGFGEFIFLIGLIAAIQLFLWIIGVVLFAH